MPVPVHTHGDSWAPWERRLWLEPASCQRVDVDAAFRFVVVVAAGAAWAAAAAPARAEAAGAGSPRHSASSRRRVLMMSSRDAICRWSEAIMACSAVGGGGGWLGRAVAPLTPLGARAAAPPPPPPPPAVSCGWCAREKGCQRRTKGREDLGALKQGGQLGGHPRLVAHRAQGARAREGEDAGASQKGTRGLRIS